METIKNFIKKINDSIDAYLPNVPNWCIWTIVVLAVYLMLK